MNELHRIASNFFYGPLHAIVQSVACKHGGQRKIDSAGITSAESFIRKTKSGFSLPTAGRRFKHINPGALIEADKSLLNRPRMKTKQILKGQIRPQMGM